MKRKVQIVAGLLVSVMLFSLAGCGNNTELSSSQSESDSEFETDTESTFETESETESETENTTEAYPDNVEGYTFTDLDKTMWTTSNLNVRDLPDTEGEKLGQLTLGQDVHVTGQCKETNWYRIEYNGGAGYVSNEYLSDEKAENPDVSNPGTPNPKVDNVKDVNGKSVKKDGMIYVIGNAAFEAYSYNESKGKAYAEIITEAADSLKGVSNVYCMPIPLGSGIVLPEEYNGKVSAGDQKAAVHSILGHMGSNVISVNIYDSLYAHRDEYIYFRTDHHWTQLGAYYAYTEFCKAKNIEAKSLDAYKHTAYDGFVGSFYFNADSKDAALKNAPDTIYTYQPQSNAKMTVTDSKGQTFAWPIINNVANYQSGIKYSCFIAGDNPYTIIENKDITDGSSCIVVKESFGNAFVPYLVDHYQTVHVIDMRYWDGSLVDFAKQNNVTDVIFMNNLSAIGSSSQQKNLKGIIE